MRPEAVIRMLEHAGKEVPALIKRAEPVQRVECDPDHYHRTVSPFVESRMPVTVTGAFAPLPAVVERLGDWKDRADSSWNESAEMAHLKRLLVHERYVQPRLWKNETDWVTHAHFDNLDNMVFMLSETKLFLVYPPSEHPRLYHRAGMFGRYRVTRADLERPDLARFPKLGDLGAPKLAALEPGDAFFLPSNFTHQVYSYSVTGSPVLAVNYWLETPLRLLRKTDAPFFEKSYALAFPFLIKTLGLARLNRLGFFVSRVRAAAKKNVLRRG